MKLMLQVGGSKSLLISELLRLNPIIQMVDSGTKHNFAQRHKTVLWLCLEKKIVSEIEQKYSIWCLKCRSININFLFIELLYTIKITFVIFVKELHPLCDINYIK